MPKPFNKLSSMLKPKQRRAPFSLGAMFVVTTVAARALADPPLGAVIDAIPKALLSECRNLVSALEKVKAAALPEWVRRSENASDCGHKARYAIVAL
ncbi:MAG TPA: hypothetical protein VGX76_08070, partial [Pirellulales bacterium]|nr:hypothetical protein [Pirellulales bacterium]